MLVFFGREFGKIRAIGKGLKRGTRNRFAAGIDLLEIGRLVVTSRQVPCDTLATLVEWKQVRLLSGLRERLPRIYAAEYVGEITSHLTEDWDPHPDLFDAMVAVLADLAIAQDVLPPLVSYLLRMLAAIGAIPQFGACVLCGRPADLTHFSSFEGGVVCKHCEPVQIEKREISNATLDVLQGHPNQNSMEGAFDVLDYHVAHLMGRQPALSAKIVPDARRRIVS